MNSQMAPKLCNSDINSDINSDNHNHNLQIKKNLINNLVSSIISIPYSNENKISKESIWNCLFLLIDDVDKKHYKNYLHIDLFDYLIDFTQNDTHSIDTKITELRFLKNNLLIYNKNFNRFLLFYLSNLLKYNTLSLLNEKITIDDQAKKIILNCQFNIRNLNTLKRIINNNTSIDDINNNNNCPICLLNNKQFYYFTECGHSICKDCSISLIHFNHNDDNDNDNQIQNNAHFNTHNTEDKKIKFINDNLNFKFKCCFCRTKIYNIIGQSQLLNEINLYHLLFNNNNKNKNDNKLSIKIWYNLSKIYSIEKLDFLFT
ncbi:uncharacterized protein ASCRUDRAFT_9705 [Ascoidea rubescens DSM 1968]|uniref:Zinc finger C3HC4 RING-type domain-containing protein n=1 Tax=Ascoidea rubescens DSM 1968 TaxID=1344418 RepID=A0A1D2VBA2_9ASCO|nr:hypothetical protein ASCRUDRAFT_9705 [Ascoidea rubescens DSM 1968]ODV58932.1 hypothetical protein ASCRUDRAFT_9705 [Ascoidea rubescens DSM 1968]